MSRLMQHHRRSTSSASETSSQPTGHKVTLISHLFVRQATIPDSLPPSTLEVDAAQLDDNTSTSAAIAGGAAGAAAVTGLAFAASGKRADAETQGDESKSVNGTQTTRYRDDLTRIEGVNEATQQAFHDAGYYKYSDIENASTHDLKKVFAGRDLGFSRSDFETWSSQAATCRLDQCETYQCETSAESTGSRSSWR